MVHCGATRNASTRAKQSKILQKRHPRDKTEEKWLADTRARARGFRARAIGMEAGWSPTKISIEPVQQLGCDDGVRAGSGLSCARRPARRMGAHGDGIRSNI